jgi:broad specificity phosphatase PhoE
VAIEVYLARHAQTTANVSGERLYNPSLTALGQQQSARLAAALAAHGLTQVVSSPLHRALETAVPVAVAARAPLSVWNDLVEFNGWDPYRGSPRRELERRFPRAALEPDMPDAGWSYPGPEPYAEARARARRVVERVGGLAADTRLALVGHGTFNGLLLGLWLGAAEGRAAFAQDNACVSHLRIEPGRVILRRLNDTGHL